MWLTNVDIFWVQWRSNWVAQNQDILKNTQRSFIILQVKVYLPARTNSPLLGCEVLDCTLPLNESQTLTQHPPSWQQIRKTGGKTAEKRLWSLLFQATIYSIFPFCRLGSSKDVSKAMLMLLLVMQRSINLTCHVSETLQIQFSVLDKFSCHC